MDTQAKIKELERQIQELQRKFALLESSTTIPLNISEAFKKRLSFQQVQASTKDKDSEDVVIDEAGVSTKTVLDDPSGFDKATINGEVHYYPYYL